MITLELLHEHGLAHAAMTINPEARWTCCWRMVAQRIKMSQYPASAIEADLAIGSNGANPCMVRSICQCGSAGRQVREFDH